MTSVGGRDAAPGVLVAGGDYRALGVVRSLGRRGIRVWVLHERGDAIAAVSRYAERRLVWPRGEPGAAARFLLDLAERHQLAGWLLVPTADETAASVAHRHAELRAAYVVSTPPWEVLRWAYDKRLTYQLAESLGIPHPRTQVVGSQDTVRTMDVSFPVVLKPAVKPTTRLQQAKAWRADDRGALLALCARAEGLAEPGTLLVQDLVPGGGEAQFSFAALCLEGEALAGVVARRTRQYPADFGRSSTMVETVDQPDVEKLARRILSALRITGLVEVEFKRDARDGRCNLLDINARVWGWHSIGARAGVDFPYLLWRLFRTGTVPTVAPRVGVRWVRASTDLPAVVAELRARRLAPGDYLRSVLAPKERAIFARDDPLPALLELPLHLGKAVIRRTAGSAGT